jgi:hypothetical protein
VADNSPFFRNTEKFQKHGTDFNYFNYFNFGKIREQLFSFAMRMDMFAQIFAVLRQTLTVWCSSKVGL